MSVEAMRGQTPPPPRNQNQNQSLPIAAKTLSVENKEGFSREEREEIDGTILDFLGTHYQRLQPPVASVEQSTQNITPSSVTTHPQHMTVATEHMAAQNAAAEQIFNNFCQIPSNIKMLRVLVFPGQERIAPYYHANEAKLIFNALNVGSTCTRMSGTKELNVRSVYAAVKQMFAASGFEGKKYAFPGLSQFSNYIRDAEIANAPRTTAGDQADLAPVAGTAEVSAELENAKAIFGILDDLLKMDKFWPRREHGQNTVLSEQQSRVICAVLSESDLTHVYALGGDSGTLDLASIYRQITNWATLRERCFLTKEAFVKEMVPSLNNARTIAKTKASQNLA